MELMKTCTKCGESKMLSAFHLHKSARTGLKSWCKVCNNVAASSYRAENIEKNKDYNERYRADHSEKRNLYNKSYREAHAGEHRAYNRAWFASNPAKQAAYGARKRANKVNATPAWADHERIKCYYRVAAMLTREGIERWHVDHIVPLQGKNVCGLHVENNLQVIPAIMNMKKHNSFNAATS